MIKNVASPSFLLALAFTPVAPHAEKLVINSNQSDPAPEQAFAKVVDEFKKQNPDLQVDFNSILQRFDKIEARVFEEQGKEASLRAPDKRREREILRVIEQAR
jgi:hypothetical protein